MANPTAVWSDYSLPQTPSPTTQCKTWAVGHVARILTSKTSPLCTSAVHSTDEKTFKYPRLTAGSLTAPYPH